MGEIYSKKNKQEKRRELAITEFNSNEDSGIVLRAIALVSLDEINRLRRQHSLTDLTRLQYFNRIRRKINDGDADTRVT